MTTPSSTKVAVKVGQELARAGDLPGAQPRLAGAVGIDAAKHLLPAHPVDGDHDDVARRAVLEAHLLRRGKTLFEALGGAGGDEHEEDDRTHDHRHCSGRASDGMRSWAEGVEILLSRKPIS